jgi:hypothetical protein
MQRYKILRKKVHGKRTFLKEKWPLGRDGLLHQGHYQPKQVTVNQFSYRYLQYLQTGWLLSSEIRKQKMSHCHIVAVRRRIRGKEEPPPAPPKGKRSPLQLPQKGESPTLLESTFIMHYAL